MVWIEVPCQTKAIQLQHKLLSFTSSHQSHCPIASVSVLPNRQLAPKLRLIYASGSCLRNLSFFLDSIRRHPWVFPWWCCDRNQPAGLEALRQRPSDLFHALLLPLACHELLTATKWWGWAGMTWWPTRLQCQSSLDQWLNEKKSTVHNSFWSMFHIN